MLAHLPEISVVLFAVEVGHTVEKPTRLTGKDSIPEYAAPRPLAVPTRAGTGAPAGAALTAAGASPTVQAAAAEAPAAEA